MDNDTWTLPRSEKFQRNHACMLQSYFNTEVWTCCLAQARWSAGETQCCLRAALSPLLPLLHAHTPFTRCLAPSQALLASAGEEAHLPDSTQVTRYLRCVSSLRGVLIHMWPRVMRFTVYYALKLHFTIVCRPNLSVNIYMLCLYVGIGDFVSSPNNLTELWVHCFFRFT